MKEYYIKQGFWGMFRIGRKAPGLHLNRVIRDVLRACGIPCPTCNEGNCNEPQVTLVTSRNVQYVNANDEKLTAVVIDLPVYNDNTFAVADGYPVNGWYITPTGDVKVVV